MRIRSRFRFAIDAHYLLTGGVRHPRKNTRLGHRRLILVPQDAAHSNVLVPESLQQESPGFVFAHDANREDIHFEVGEVIDGVRASARNDGALAMFQYEHRCFPGNTGDFAVYELIGYQVRQHGHGDLRKNIENLFEPLAFFGMPDHPGNDSLMPGSSARRWSAKWYPRR